MRISSRCRCGKSGGLYERIIIGQTGTMDKVERLKRHLGPATPRYNEAQLQELSRELDLIAEFLLNRYMLKRSGKEGKTKRVDRLRRRRYDEGKVEKRKAHDK